MQCKASTYSRGWSAFNPHRPRRSGAISGDAKNEGEVVVLSILTAPEGAVQSRRYDADNCVPAAFQSSPPPKERCNGVTQPIVVHYDDFQSSPPPKERCNPRKA